MKKLSVIVRKHAQMPVNSKNLQTHKSSLVLKTAMPIQSVNILPSIIVTTATCIRHALNGAKVHNLEVPIKNQKVKMHIHTESQCNTKNDTLYIHLCIYIYTNSFLNAGC